MRKYNYNRNAVVRDLKRGMRNVDVAKKHGMSVAMVGRIKAHEGLTPGGKKEPDWSSEELKILKREAKKLVSYEEVAKKLPGRSVTAIKVKAKRLRLDRNFYTGGKKSIKRKQAFYPILAKYYETHTRKECLEFVKSHGYDENYLKHFLWRVWPRLRKKKKAEAAGMRYSIKEICAFLKVAKGYTVSDDVKFGSGAHHFSRLYERFRGIRFYWGCPSIWVSKLIGSPKNVVNHYLTPTGVMRADGKYYHIKRYSWIDLNTFLSENAFYRRQVNPHALRTIALMARFEGYLNEITKDWETPEEAMQYLIEMRAKHGVTSARKEIERQQSLSKTANRLPIKKRKASRQARGADGPGNQGRRHPGNRKSRNGLRR